MVDIDELPSTNGLKAALVAAGITTYPVDMWVDSQARPVRVDTSTTIRSVTTTVTEIMSEYNVPVTITAPPADQIAPH